MKISDYINKSIKQTIEKDNLLKAIEASDRIMHEISDNLKLVIKYMPATSAAEAKLKELNPQAWRVIYKDLSSFSDSKSPIGGLIYFHKAIMSSTSSLTILADQLPRTIYPDAITAKQALIHYYATNYVLYANSVLEGLSELLNILISSSKGLPSKMRQNNLEKLVGVPEFSTLTKDINKEVKSTPDLMANDPNTDKLIRSMSSKTNPIFNLRVKGFAGNPVVALRVMLSSATEWYYQSLDERTKRLKITLTLLELQEEGEYNPELSKQLDRINAAIQKNEAAIQKYRG